MPVHGPNNQIIARRSGRTPPVERSVNPVAGFRVTFDIGDTLDVQAICPPWTDVPKANRQ